MSGMQSWGRVCRFAIAVILATGLMLGIGLIFRRYGLGAAANVAQIISAAPIFVSLIAWGRRSRYPEISRYKSSPRAAARSSYGGAPSLFRDRRRMRVIGITGLVLCVVGAIIPVVLRETGSSPRMRIQCPSWRAGPPVGGGGSGAVASSATPAGVLSVPGGDYIRNVAFDRGGSSIAAATGNSESQWGPYGHVYIWNTMNSKNIVALPDQYYRDLSSDYNSSDPSSYGNPAFVTFSPVGDFIAVNNGYSIVVSDLGSCASSKENEDFLHTELNDTGYSDMSETDYWTSVSYIPGSASIVAGSRAGHIAVLNPGGDWSEIPNPVSGGEIKQVEANSSGTYIAGVGGGERSLIGDVYIWNRSNGFRYGPIPAQQQIDAVNSISFSPDGSKLAVASIGGTVLWDVARHKRISVYGGYDTTPQAEAFSPNGATLAVGDADGYIYIWDASKRRLINKIKCSIQSWQGLEFSPDGKMLAAFGHQSSAIYLYHMTYGGFSG